MAGIRLFGVEAAYESDMWSAVLNAKRGASNRVLLTFLGGGAFGNEEEWILARCGGRWNEYHHLTSKRGL